MAYNNRNLFYFWRLEVQNQGIGRAILSLKFLGKNLFHALLIPSGVASSPCFFCFCFLALDASLPSLGLHWWTSGKESVCQCRRQGFDPWVRKIPWSRQWQPTLEFLPGESCGHRSLAGCSPWGCRVGHDWVTEHTPISASIIISLCICVCIFTAYKAQIRAYPKDVLLAWLHLQIPYFQVLSCSQVPWVRKYTCHLGDIIQLITVPLFELLIEEQKGEDKGEIAPL